MTKWKMNNAILYIFALCILYVQVEAQDLMECQVWTDVMQAVKQVDSINVTCSHNPICTGFDCSGIYNIISNKGQMQFGAEFMPCNPSLELDVYMSLLGTTVRRSISVTADKQHITFPMPPLQAMSHISVNATILIGVQLVSPRNISFQMDATLAFGTHQFSYILVPLLYLRVPDCVSKTSTPVHDVVSGTTVRPTPSMAEMLTGANCTVGVYKSVTSCGNMQMCKDSQCVCMHERVWSKDMQQCVEKQPMTSKPVPVIVIAVVCLLTSIIIAGILTAVAVKCRRYRQRYGQHEPLINNEGGDRDLEVESDPPMLQA
jgi:hypothetical protein